MPKTYKVIDPATLDPRGGPRQLVRHADAAGFAVEVHRSKLDPDLLAVGGIRADAGLAFVAWWQGKATLGSVLYDEVERGYHEVEAPVEVKVGKTQVMRQTGYVGGVRLVYDGGPRGLSLGVNDLKARMAAL